MTFEQAASLHVPLLGASSACTRGGKVSLSRKSFHRQREKKVSAAEQHHEAQFLTNLDFADAFLVQGSCFDVGSPRTTPRWLDKPRGGRDKSLKQDVNPSRLLVSQLFEEFRRFGRLFRKVFE